MKKALEWIFKVAIVGVGILIGISITTSCLGPVGLGGVIGLCTFKLIKGCKKGGS